MKIWSVGAMFRTALDRGIDRALEPIPCTGIGFNLVEFGFLGGLCHVNIRSCHT